MKWLSHKFWIWVWRKLDSHRLIEEMSTPFDFTIEPGVSIPLSPEDKAEKEAGVATLLDNLHDPSFLERVNEHISNLEAVELTNSEVIKDRILNQDKWEEPIIKKGYEKK